MEVTVEQFGKTMVELHDLLANSPPEAKELITTSFREKTEAALQVGLMYATNSKKASRAYMQTKMAFRRADIKGKGSVMQRFVSAASQEEAQEAADAAQIKSQFQNLLEVKEQIDAEARSAQLVQGSREKCAGCPHMVQDGRT